jgi:hypothetical protein
VIERRQNSTSNKNFPSRVALAFVPGSTGEQPISFCLDASEPIVEHFNPIPHWLCH